MNTFDCSGNIIITSNQGNEYLTCDGSWTVVTVKDIDAVFTEYLAPDPAIISLVLSSGLVFWAIGHSLGRFMAVMRKVS